MSAESLMSRQGNNPALLHAVHKLVEVDSRLPQLVRTPHLRSEYDAQEHAVWMFMRAPRRPCFTPEILRDIIAQQDAIMRQPAAVDFFVVASDVPGVFNLGGDLDLFRTLTQQKDEEALLRYAESCVRAVHNDLIGLDAGIVTLALVQGDALGGGFEAALSCHIVIAEKGVKMGFPEIMFNLFPGMGAFSLVARKVGPRLAEDLIANGRVCTSDEMYDLGLVDHLAEKGKGEWVAHNVISDKSHCLRGYRAYQKAKLKSNLNVPYDELLEITRGWVNAALQLDSHDIKIMERLVRAQERLAATRLTGSR
jgi:DSF synthase